MEYNTKLITKEKGGGFHHKTLATLNDIQFSCDTLIRLIHVNSE